VIAVALAVTCLSSLVFLRASVAQAAAGVTNAVASGEIYVLPKGATLADPWTKSPADRGYLHSELTEVILGVKGVSSALALFAGSVILEDAQGQPITARLAPTIGYGVHETSPGGYQYLEGALPSKPSEVALEFSTARLTGLAVGDTTRLVDGGAELSVTVSGIVRYDQELGGTSLVLMDHITALAWFSPTGMVPAFAISPTASQSADDVIKALRVKLGNEVVILTGDQARKQALRELDRYYLEVWAIGLGVIIAIFFLVGSAIYTIIATRARTWAAQFATLEALGATSRQLRTSAVMRGLWDGLVGSLIGLVAGFGLSLIVRLIGGSAGLDLPLGLP
jgi:putative ABC transport system permease protein